MPDRKHNIHYDLNYLIRVANKYKKKLILGNLISLLAVLTSIPLPLFLPILVDEVLLNEPGIILHTINRFSPIGLHNPAFYILTILAITLFLRGINLALNTLQSRQFTIIAKQIIYKVRRRLLWQLQRVSMTEYESLGSGKVASHLVTDLETIDKFISQTISRFIIAVLTVSGVAAILLWLHWQIALIILIVNPVVIYCTMILGKNVKKLKQQENSAFEIFQQTLIETLEAIRQIRANNREKHYFKSIIEKASMIRRYGIDYAWKSDTVSRLSFMVFLLGFDIFRAIAMLMVVYSDLSIGKMFAVFGYLWFMMGPVQEILNIQYAYYSAKAALDRINCLQTLHDEPKYPHNKNPFKGQQTIGLKIVDLHFAYDFVNKSDILKGINMNIEPGAKIAFVGASGGGKSTLSQVLIGLYPPREGMVYYGGVPLNEIGLSRVRKNVVMVLQHPILFNDSVRNNLTLGRQIPDDNLWQALEIAQLKDTMMENGKSGLETRLGHNGMRLSGGQRQRLAIARMVLSQPKIVLLDEATSALDSDTEKKLYAQLGDFLTGITTITIAHRLATIQQADHVYVLEDGKILEQGNHRELLSNQSSYAKLYG